MKRRDFIRLAGGAGLAQLVCPKSASAIGGPPFVAPASRPVPGILDIGDRRQTFLDDQLIAEVDAISKFTPRPEKYAGNPVIRPDRPWEQVATSWMAIERNRHPRMIDGQPVYGGAEPGELIESGVEIQGQCVLYDDEEKLFKIWYLPFTAAERKRLMCYATSRDGYHWEKPELGLCEFGGSKRNNIVTVGLPLENVFKDPHDPDPARRYKGMGFFWTGEKTGRAWGVVVAFSPDGLHWMEYAQNPVIAVGRNDADSAIGVFWDPRRKKYVYYPRPGHPLAPEIYGDGDHRHIRSIGYTESDDFVHWLPTRPMLTPDYGDRADVQYMEFVSALDGEFYVGLNSLYFTGEEVWDTYVMSSRDGFHWNWINREAPLLPRGEIGSYDAGYMAPSAPIFHDGKVWIYYGAFSGGHSENVTKFGAKNAMSVALCTLPCDRWLGLLAGPNRGTVVTRPVLFDGNRLFVDLDAAVPMQPPRTPPRFDECVVRAALVDASGGPIEGFALEKSRGLTRSGRQELRWPGADVGRLAGRPVRIQFEMRNATLYSFQFG